MIAEFRFDYNGPKATKENLKLLQSLVRENVREWQEKDNDSYIYGHFTGDLNAVIKAFPGSHIVIITSDLTPSTWEEILMRLDRIETRIGPVPTTHNEHVRVIVPDLGLLYMRYVEVLEDCCTRDLQSHLNRGWRILAVCPQASRRPDYIIGRNTDRDFEPPDQYLPPEAQ